MTDKIRTIQDIRKQLDIVKAINCELVDTRLKLLNIKKENDISEPKDKLTTIYKIRPSYEFIMDRSKTLRGIANEYIDIDLENADVSGEFCMCAGILGGAVTGALNVADEAMSIALSIIE